MKKNSISEFELERQEFKIRLKRGPSGSPVASFEEGLPPASYGASGALPPTVVPMPAPATASGPVASGPELEIKAPMIGTFYRSPSPEAANYVDVGTEVGPDTVVCIIEAMKVMNEIKAETKGVISQVLVENAKPVEFGQPMFKIRPA